MSLLVGAAAGMAASLAGVSLSGVGGPLVLSGSVTLGLVLAGWWAPALVFPVYRGWNRLAAAFGRRAARWVSRAAFLSLSISGRGGSRFRAESPSPQASGWVRRESGPMEWPSSQSLLEREDADAANWLWPLLGWARRSSNWWVWTMAPCLAVLSTLRKAAPRGVVSEKNYTLY